MRYTTDQWYSPTQGRRAPQAAHAFPLDRKGGEHHAPKQSVVRKLSGPFRS